MKKFDMRKIMTRAWEIAKFHGYSISYGLKRAWTEAKKAMELTAARSHSIFSEEKIAELEAKGFSRWTKYGKDRMYIDADKLGLELDFYKSGHIHSALFNGECISNSKARTLWGAKTYIDLMTGKVYSTCEKLLEAATALMNA